MENYTWREIETTNGFYLVKLMHEGERLPFVEARKMIIDLGSENEERLWAIRVRKNQAG